MNANAGHPPPCPLPQPERTASGEPPNQGVMTPPETLSLPCWRRDVASACPFMGHRGQAAGLSGAPGWRRRAGGETEGRRGGPGSRFCKPGSFPSPWTGLDGASARGCRGRLPRLYPEQRYPAKGPNRSRNPAQDPLARSRPLWTRRVLSAWPELQPTPPQNITHLLHTH